MAYSKIDWNMSRTVLCNNVKVLYFCATFQFTTRFEVVKIKKSQLYTMDKRMSFYKCMSQL